MHAKGMFAIVSLSEEKLGIFLDIIGLQHLQRYPYIDCKLCTHQCECVGTKNFSLTEKQGSRNL